MAWPAVGPLITARLRWRPQWGRARCGLRAPGVAGGGGDLVPWPPGRRPGGVRGPRASGAVGADWSWGSSIPSRRPGGALGPGGVEAGGLPPSVSYACHKDYAMHVSV